MADAPIGISFIPSAQNQAQQGPRQAGLEGDLSQAFKILSLRLPQNIAPTAPVPQALLTGPGSAGVLGGPPSASPASPGAPASSMATYDPYAAVFTALLRSMAGGDTSAMAGMGGEGLPRPRVSLPADPNLNTGAGSDLPGAMRPPSLPDSSMAGPSAGGFDTPARQPENAY